MEPYDWENDPDPADFRGPGCLSRLFFGTAWRLWLFVRLILVMVLLAAAIAAAFVALGATVLFVIKYLIERGEG